MLSIIAAVANNNVIGSGNRMPWHLPGDLRYFKRITDGKTIIMGRKTFESLPGLLPNRRHIVITRNRQYIKERVETALSLDAAIKKAPVDEEAFIIGGASVYAQAMDLCERLYITEIHADFNGDTFFPEIDKSKYALVSMSESCCENGIMYRFLQYQA